MYLIFNDLAVFDQHVFCYKKPRHAGLDPVSSRVLQHPVV